MIKLLTLNVAHGRKDGIHQLFQKRSAIECHLDDIARVLRRERPEVVALQEADGPSLWSGRFNHVEYLAKQARYANSVRGEHVRALKLSYGTALLSSLPLREPLAVTFAPSPPTFSKGFVAGSFDLPETVGPPLRVVSVHLDFLRESVRHRQVEDLIQHLSSQQQRLVILGDFNCDWGEQNSPLRRLAEELDLTAFEPEAINLATFPKSGKRLDWILISRDLEFASYHVLPETLSDHRAVVAEIRIRD